jgi:hypothetical protein
MVGAGIEAVAGGTAGASGKVHPVMVMTRIRREKNLAGVKRTIPPK